MSLLTKDDLLEILEEIKEAQPPGGDLRRAMRIAVNLVGYVSPQQVKNADARIMLKGFFLP